MILDLPDIRQRADHDCGDAAGLCVTTYHGLRPYTPISTLDGTPPHAIADAFYHRGFAVIGGEARLADLKHWCDTGRPPICLVHFPVDTCSHYVTVAGVHRGYVHFQDPAEGPRKLKVARWEDAWHAMGNSPVHLFHWALVIGKPFVI